VHHVVPRNAARFDEISRCIADDFHAIAHKLARPFFVRPAAIDDAGQIADERSQEALALLKTQFGKLPLDIRRFRRKFRVHVYDFHRIRIRLPSRRFYRKFKAEKVKTETRFGNRLHSFSVQVITLACLTV
jgi:hypothetical protein